MVCCQWPGARDVDGLAASRAKAIPASRCIAARPAAIATRQELRHWEGDLVIFAHRSGSVNVTSLEEH